MMFDFFKKKYTGCGIVGFKDSEIPPLFKAAMSAPNICLPESFFYSYSVRKTIKYIQFLNEFRQYTNYEMIRCDLQSIPFIHCSSNIEKGCSDFRRWTWTDTSFEMNFAHEILERDDNYSTPCQNRSWRQYPTPGSDACRWECNPHATPSCANTKEGTPMSPQWQHG